MKRTFFTLAMCLMASVAWSQNVAFHQSDKSGKKLTTNVVLQMMPSDNEGELLAVEAKLNAMGMVKGLQVCRMNEGWKELDVVKIDDTRGITVDAFREGDRVHLLLGSFDKKGSRLRHVVLSASPLQVVTDSLLADVKCGKDEQCYIKTASSPSNNYHAVVYTLEGGTGDHATAMLYDGGMKCLRVCDLPHGEVSQIVVTDRGEVVTACLLTSPNHEQCLLRFNVADAAVTRSGEALINGDLEQLALLNYAGGNVLCAALEGEDSHGKRQYTAFHALVYDMKTSTLRVDTRHAFTHDELCVFENEDTGSKRSSNSTNYVLLRDQLTTASGGAVLFQREWSETLRQNGMELSASFNRRGMIVANLDTLGRILWTRGIMQNNKHATLSVRGPYLLEHEGTIYVIANESKNESPEYNPTVAAKGSKSLLMANAALSAYWFTPEGKGAKQMLGTDGKYLILSPLHSFGGGKYYLMTGGNAPQISYIILR